MEGGTAPYSYLWDDPLAQNQATAVNLQAGTYSVTVTDANGCTTSDAALITQPDQLTVDVMATPVICRGADDGSATATVNGGTGEYTYRWSSGGTTQTVTGLPEGDISVTVTDENGCEVTGGSRVDEPAASIEITIVQDEQGCAGLSQNVATGSAVGGTGTGYTYLWSNGETTATAVALPDGEVTLTVTDDGGCAVTESFTIEDLPAVTINMLLGEPTCSDRADGSVGADPSGGLGRQTSDYTFLWSNGETTPVITGLVGNRTYGVTVTGPGGCIGTAERFLAAPPGITFQTDEQPVLCTGGSTGGLTVFNVSGPNAGDYQFQWGPEAGGATTPTISGLPAGQYSLTITDVGTCTLDTVLTITEPTELAPAIEQTNVSCFGEADGILVASGTGGVGGYGFAWSTGSNQPRITGLVAGTYSLTLTDANDCESITDYVITQPAPLEVTATPGAVLCEGDATGRVTLEAIGGTGPFVYTIEGIGTTRNNVFLGLSAGTYSASIRDANGCSIGTDVIVEDGPFFDVDLGTDSTIVFGDSIFLTPEIFGGVDTLIYDWRPSYAGTLSCTDCPNPSARPEYEIDYTLVLTDGNGCVAEDRVRISVTKIRNVDVPTGFSPDGNGINDRLIVHGRPGTTVEYFGVYDRWTNLLFEDSEYPVNDATRGWDGTHEGEPVTAGVYLYKLVIRYEDGSTETLSGETTIVR